MYGGQHYIFQRGYSCRSRPQWASMNDHRGYALSRRDDLECLGYTLIYFLHGSLPWKYTSVDTVFSMKKQLVPAKLCRDDPVEFREYFEHVLSLGFTDRPDYAMLRDKFRRLFERQGYEYDGKFDWIVQEEEEKKRREEEKRAGVDQMSGAGTLCLYEQWSNFR